MKTKKSLKKIVLAAGSVLFLTGCTKIIEGEIISEGEIMALDKLWQINLYKEYAVKNKKDNKIYSSTMNYLNDPYNVGDCVRFGLGRITSQSEESPKKITITSYEILHHSLCGQKIPF